MKTPFSLQLNRYVGIDPSQQPEADSRGVEFVYFQNQLLLKISGNYNAAYSAERLTAKSTGQPHVLRRDRSDPVAGCETDSRGCRVRWDRVRDRLPRAHGQPEFRL